MNDIELIIILGFYYIGKEKGIEKFTSRFNSCFGRDFSVQTIIHEVSIFRNIDPSNNVKNYVADERYLGLWNEYIGKEKITELKALYKSFMNSDFIPNDIKNTTVSGQMEDDIPESIVDEPKTLVEVTNSSSEKYKRDPSVVINALARAGYQCEGECDYRLFLKKDGIHNYTEAHHLIPLMYQKHFMYSLDVEANVVSLCPMCHRLLHYGFDKQKLLKKLYQKRSDRLDKVGLSVSYEKLLFLYAGDVEDDV